jgi:hypothetical protein
MKSNKSYRTDGFNCVMGAIVGGLLLPPPLKFRDIDIVIYIVGGAAIGVVMGVVVEAVVRRCV